MVAATGLDPDVCRAAAEAADGDCRVALVSLLADVAVPTARRLLDSAEGGVRRAVELARADGARLIGPVTGNEGVHR